MSQLNNLTVQALYSPQATITTLTGGSASFASISSSGTTSSLSAATANVTALNANVANIGVSTVQVENVAVLTAQTANVASLSASVVNMGSTNAQQSNVAVLTAQTANVASLSASVVNIGSSNAQQSNVAVLIAQTANVASLSASVVNMGSSTAQQSNVAVLTAQTANVASLSASVVNMGSSTAQQSNVAVLIAQTANVASLSAPVVNMGSSTAQQSNVAVLIAQTANVASLSASVVNMGSSTAQQSNVAVLNVQVANINSSTVQLENVAVLYAQSANVQTLVGQSATFTTISSTGNTGTLTAAIGNLTSLNAKQANVQSLVVQIANATQLNAQSATVAGPVLVSGNVGILTTTPNYPLDVAGSSRIQGSLGVQTVPSFPLDVSGTVRAAISTSTGRATGFRLENLGTSAGGATFDMASQFPPLAQPSKIAGQMYAEPDNSTGGRVVFATASTSGPLITAMTMNAVQQVIIPGQALIGNNVGILTGTPAFPLDVAGTARIAGQSLLGSNVGILTSSPAFPLDVAGTTRISGQTLLGSNVGIQTTTPAFPLDVAGIARVSGQTLLGSNVGILTSTPAFPLDVAGSVRVSGGMNLPGTTTLNFASDSVSKDINAGRIGYGTFSATSLDIVGAGTGLPRSVRIWEQLGVAMNPSYPLDVGGTARISGQTLLGSNVGILTTVPAFPLDVAGAARISGNVTLSNASIATLTVLGNSTSVGPLSLGTANTLPTLGMLNPIGTGGIYFEPGNLTGGGGTGWNMINFNGFYNNTDVLVNPARTRWRIGADQRGGTEKFIIDQVANTGSSNSYLTCVAGNLGIQQYNPQYPLDVTGTTRVQGGFLAQAALFSGSLTAAGANFGGPVAVTGNLTATTLVATTANVQGGMTVTGDIVLNGNLRQTLATGGAAGPANYTFGNIAAANAAVTGTLVAGASTQVTYPITLSTTLNAYTQICNISDPQTAATYMIRVVLVQSRGQNAVLKTYNVPVAFNYLPTTWVRCVPEYNMGPNNGNDFALDMTSTLPAGTQVVTIRAVRTGNALNPNTGLTAYVNVTSDTGYPITLNYDGTTGTGATNAGLYTSSPIGVTTGNVGILTTTPAFPLDVTGSARVTGTLTAGAITAGTAVTDTSIGAAASIVNRVANVSYAFPQQPVFFQNSVGNTQYYVNTDYNFPNQTGAAPGGRLLINDSQFSSELRWQSKIAGTAATSYTNPLTERFTITSAGNVGINQPLPQFTLDVAGSTRLTGNVSVLGNINAAGGTFTGNLNVFGAQGISKDLAVYGSTGVLVQSPNSCPLQLVSTNGGSGNPIGIGLTTFLNRVGGPACLVTAIDDGAGCGHLVLSTATPGSSTGIASERMRITSTGNVGINQPSPQFTLDVAGSARVTGNLNASTAAIGTFTGQPTFQTNQLFQKDNAPGFYLGRDFSTNNSGFITFNNAGPPSGVSTVGIGVFGQSPGGGLSVANTGYVGVNYSTPAYPLDVGGQARITGQIFQPYQTQWRYDQNNSPSFNAGATASWTNTSFTYVGYGQLNSTNNVLVSSGTPTSASTPCPLLTFPFSGVYTVNFNVRFNATSNENSIWLAPFVSSFYGETSANGNSHRHMYTSGTLPVCLTYTGYWNANDTCALCAYSAANNSLSPSFYCGVTVTLNARTA